MNIVERNIRCSMDLPQINNAALTDATSLIHGWSKAVERFTADCRVDFAEHPEQFQHEEGFFRFLTMVTVLKRPRGLGISYHPSAIGNVDFSDARYDFLYGIFTERLGTCASLPVLFVAIGRELGYPMHLAVSKGHFFCQWVKPDGSHLNLEGSGPGGGEMFSDAHFRKWPRELTSADLASNRFLRPLSPEEELASFLEIRGHCLADNDQYALAREAYHQAHEAAPHWSDLERHLLSIEMRERQLGEGLNLKKSVSGTAWLQFPVLKIVR